MIINMNVGGTERALLNMVAEMPKNKYDITIFMLEEYGGFLESIPVHVHKEYLNGYQNIKEIVHKPLRKVIKGFLKKGHLIKVFNFLIILFLSKITKNNSSLFQYILKGYPSLTNEYDVAIAYAGPMDFISYFVVHKIKAKKKIQWIHFDVKKIGFNINFATKIYKMFDQIYTVSSEGKNQLIKKLPKIKNKTDVFLNVISPKEIIKMANNGAGFTDQFDGLRILTVGRLSKEKGQDLVIPVIAKLIRSGFKVRWYCIGEGNAREEYEKLIKINKVEQNFILLGATPNPYTFMKQCDIYVQPSRHEGYCITLAEARVFNKPIICTNFTGAQEQIMDGLTGRIINFDETEMLVALKDLIKDRQLRNRFKTNLSSMANDGKEQLKYYI